MNGLVVIVPRSICGEWPTLLVRLARAINTGVNLPTISFARRNYLHEFITSELLAISQLLEAGATQPLSPSEIQICYTALFYFDKKSWLLNLTF